MIIKSIKLENFQSHKESILDLHPSFNAIQGVGNSGKSSIVRALSFVFYGAWDNSWVRAGEKFCKITLTTDSEVIITREKGDKVNRYIVEEPGKKKQIYENFGVHIPAEIQQLLQIFKAQLDDNDYLNLNLASQLDPLFLLSRPGSSKAKILGKLTGAHFLDYSLREINKDKKNLTAEKNLKASELLEAQKQLLDFHNLDAQKLELDKFKIKIDSIDKKQNTIDQLKALYVKTSSWKQRYSQTFDEEEILNHWDAPKLNLLTQKIEYYNRLQQINIKLSQWSEKLSKAQQDQILLDQALEKARHHYVEMLRQSKKCPTCQSPIDDAVTHMLEENL